MPRIIPDFAWYAAQSKAAGTSPRCPIASAELCPRYYSSLWLLGSIGVTTSISSERQKQLDRKWQPFQPTIAEEEPSVSKPGDTLVSFSGFCPEVAYDVFHHFVSHLSRYSDEMDSGLMHEALAREHAPTSDPRWNWALSTPRHYTECREYAIFSRAELPTASARKHRSRFTRQPLSPKTRWQVFARDSFTCQYCGRRPPEVALEVDHRVAVANGGSDDLENLYSACVECNRGKGIESAGETH